MGNSKSKVSPDKDVSRTMNKLDVASKILGAATIAIIGISEIASLISEHQRITNLKGPISKEDLGEWEIEQVRGLGSTCLQIALLLIAGSPIGIVAWVVILFFMLFSFASFFFTNLYVKKKD